MIFLSVFSYRSEPKCKRNSGVKQIHGDKIVENNTITNFRLEQEWTLFLSKR